MNVNDALALDRPQPVAGDGLEHTGAVALIAVAGALQFSIAVAQILLTVALVCWAATLVAAAFSSDPRASLADCKQLVLFLLVPAVYRLVGRAQTRTLVTVVLTCAAVSAAFGVIQYGILHYDQLSQRPQGTLGHYMT